MPLCVEDCAEELDEEAALAEPQQQGCRVQSERVQPAAAAWSEGEHDRFLKNHDARSKIQTGATLDVRGTSLHGTKHKKGKPKVKTKFQKRKERLAALLKPPYYILTIVTINLCVQVWCTGEAAAALQWAPGACVAQPWRALTYGLLHASSAHFALNALVALVVGWGLEREQGWARVCGVWWGGVLGGALGACVLQPGARVVGSSAAVYAMLTAHLPNVIIRFGHVPLWWFRPLSVVVIGASEVMWALLRLRAQPPMPLSGAAAAVRRSLVRTQPDEHVAWAAHAFGALAGVLAGFVLFTGENLSKRHVVCCRVTCALLLGGAGAASLAAYVYCLAMEYL